MGAWVHALALGLLCWGGCTRAVGGLVHALPSATGATLALLITKWCSSSYHHERQALPHARLQVTSTPRSPNPSPLPAQTCGCMGRRGCGKGPGCKRKRAAWRRGGAAPPPQRPAPAATSAPHVSRLTGERTLNPSSRRHSLCASINDWQYECSSPARVVEGQGLCTCVWARSASKGRHLPAAQAAQHWHAVRLTMLSYAPVT